MNKKKRKEKNLRRIKQPRSHNPEQTIKFKIFFAFLLDNVETLPRARLDVFCLSHCSHHQHTFFSPEENPKPKGKLKTLENFFEHKGFKLLNFSSETKSKGFVNFFKGFFNCFLGRVRVFFLLFLSKFIRRGFFHRGD